MTQEELAEKSGVSVRTIQRIEAGTQPKGYTLNSIVVNLLLIALLNASWEITNQGHHLIVS